MRKKKKISFDFKPVEKMGRRKDQIMRVFKNAIGRYFVKDLFIEEATDPKTALYTLKRKETNGYQSLYECYLQSVELDETEYLFSTTYLDGWEHWKLLKSTEWFKPFYEKWSEEAEVAARAKALRAIKDTAEDSEPKANFQANRYLLEKGWEGRTDQKDSVGRPSKQKIEKAAQELSKAQQTVLDDYERLKTYSELTEGTLN